MHIPIRYTVLLNLWDHWLIQLIVSTILTLFGVRTESAVLLLILFTIDYTIAGIVRLTRPADVPANHMRREFRRIAVFVIFVIVLNIAANGDPLLKWLGPLSFTSVTVAEITYIFKGLAKLERRVLFLYTTLRRVLRRNTDAALKEYVGAIDAEDTSTPDEAGGRVGSSDADAD